MKKFFFFLVLSVVFSLIVHPVVLSAKEDGLMAKAMLSPTKGNKVQGAVEFVQTQKGIWVHAEVMGLSPGLHGFHIHEFGDCSAPNGASAGGHFNPKKKPHAGPEAENRHVGDLGNLEADKKGRAVYRRFFPGMKLEGKEGIIGRSVIVHEKEDDLKSQPAGAAGERVACGVIGWAKASEKEHAQSGSEKSAHSGSESKK